MNQNKVDMTLERSPKQWSDLLHAVKVNNDNINDDRHKVFIKDKN